MGVENDKKDLDLAYVTQHITLWFSLKHGYSMSWYFDAFLSPSYTVTILGHGRATTHPDLSN